MNKLWRQPPKRARGLIATDTILAYVSTGSPLPRTKIATILTVIFFLLFSFPSFIYIYRFYHIKLLIHFVFVLHISGIRSYILQMSVCFFPFSVTRFATDVTCLLDQFRFELSIDMPSKCMNVKIRYAAILPLTDLCILCVLLCER